MQLVNEGIGIALVPRAMAMVASADTVMRRVADLPDNLRSDLYVATGPSSVSPLVRRILEASMEELATDRIDSVQGDPLPRMRIGRLSR